MTQEEPHGIINVKLKTGEDLVGIDEGSDGLVQRVLAPVILEVHPQGMSGRSWLMFSDEETAVIPLDQTMYVHGASEVAVDYYRTFMVRLAEAEASAAEHESWDGGESGYLH